MQLRGQLRFGHICSYGVNSKLCAVTGSHPNFSCSYGVNSNFFCSYGVNSVLVTFAVTGSTPNYVQLRGHTPIFRVVTGSTPIFFADTGSSGGHLEVELTAQTDCNLTISQLSLSLQGDRQKRLRRATRRAGAHVHDAIAAWRCMARAWHVH